MRKSKYTSEVLVLLVSRSSTLAEVLRLLGLKATGGNYRMLALRIRYLGISTTHFKGAGWAKGRTQSTHLGVANSASARRRSDDEVFVENSPENCGARLGRRLRRLGREYVCQRCGLREWNGSPLSLHVDHINGVNNDNRLGNLRFLCPNCHSQTESYCKKGYATAAR